YDVQIWAYEQEVAGDINSNKTNNLYLPGISLPPNLIATSDISEAVSGARFIVNAVPAQNVRAIFSRLQSDMKREAVIISLTKGIENGTLSMPSTILSATLNKPVSVLSGPSFAKEVANKMPTAVTLAMNDKSNSRLLQEMLSTDFFRVYTHDDIIGVEIGGALKNVIAIAAGISDGLGFGFNSRAALITRGLAEIQRLGVAMGAREVTFSGLSGLGDLVLTCTAPLSRNYSVGYRLGRGERLDEITSQTRVVAEGVPTTLSVYELSLRHNIEMPITEQVYLTLYKGKDPRETLTDLMQRMPRSEFDSVFT
ncbi:MAG: NAD(P)-dependent glycerol-3-phosphate dehydrogenase, partial [Nitrospirae bacterium]|nr:NAD(P)-dependent glycerol-3-phosphate dehydrogenase [Nitrospirota bacterium]